MVAPARFDAPAPLNAQVVETLYAEALCLADEARAAFEPSDMDQRDIATNAEQIARSIEGLRTTTRVMHMLAWLLNQRAYFSGELNKTQLERHGALPPDRAPDKDHVALLDGRARAVIEQTELLYARIVRIEQEQRGEERGGEGPANAMQNRLAAAFDRAADA